MKVQSDPNSPFAVTATTPIGTATPGERMRCVSTAVIAATPSTPASTSAPA